MMSGKHWNKIFASQSKAHITHLSSQLFTLRKGSQSATNFFFNIRKISDELAITSQPLSSDDTITCLLAGLGHHYNSLVTIVTTRQDLITLEKLYSLMLITESIIIANNIASFISNNSANLSTRQHNSFQPRSRGNFRGRGCGYHRTRYSNTSARGQFNRDPIYCQLCDKLGHTVKTCYSRSDVFDTNQPSDNNIPGMIVAKNSPTNTVWHPVTGATHHFTNDLTNLNLKHDDYDGTDHIQVGNGAGLQITKTSSSILSSSSKSFVLQNLLPVLDITKNLLSVHQFCKDNNVYFEFHDYFFLIKNYLGNIIDKGPFNKGPLNNHH
jgi:histone deacetylase 1/2